MDYVPSHCWQYTIRRKNLETDLKESGITKEDAASLRVGDFAFAHIPKEDKAACGRVKEFITKHEWLGSMPRRPTHRFAATYKGRIAGVVVMATPNAFSPRLLGRENRDREKLVSRGACISWSPKNLGSALVMYSVRWMAKNTPFRFFSAYSDTRAGEIGTIYQACNFLYLGQNSGDRFEYFDPRDPQKGWFSERLFRKPGNVKKLAAALGIRWQKLWNPKDRILWDGMPRNVAKRLRRAIGDSRGRCTRRRIPRKHKYLLIAGRDGREAKRLIGRFKERNPALAGIPYPKRKRPVEPPCSKTPYPATVGTDTAVQKKIEKNPQKDLPKVGRSVMFFKKDGGKEEKWLSTKEAAAYLGITPNALRIMVHRGKIKTHRLGGRLRFSTPNLGALIKEKEGTGWR